MLKKRVAVLLFFFLMLFTVVLDSGIMISNAGISKINESGNELKLTSVSVDNGKVDGSSLILLTGKKVTFTFHAAGGAGGYTYSAIAVNRGSNETVCEDSVSNKIEWTPRSASTGWYLHILIRDSSGASVTSSYKLLFQETITNDVTIYYKGYDNPYIHYQIGDGGWTTPPGIRMQASDDVEGFDYRAVIDLGEAETLTACFNNGNGVWDSNNGRNYVFGTGYYTYRNGIITSIAKPVFERLSIGSIEATNAKVDESTKTITFYKGKKGVLRINAAGGDGKYSYNLQVSCIASGTGQAVANSTTKELIYTPNDEVYGDTAIFNLTDKSGNSVREYYIVKVEEKTGNEITIYYTGYNNPYIHYKIGNGEWTTPPGVPMETCNDMAGYPYKAVIDLGDAQTFTACFNDGNGSWDNNNGNNYYFSAPGIYTYSNGQITWIRN